MTPLLRFVKQSKIFYDHVDMLEQLKEEVKEIQSEISSEYDLTKSQTDIMDNEKRKKLIEKGQGRQKGLMKELNALSD